MDRHPDPIYKYGEVKVTGEEYDASQEAMPHHARDKFWNMAMQVPTKTGRIRLLKQVGYGQRLGTVVGWDKRWVDVGSY